MERKLFSLEAAEVKFAADKPGFFAGYASKFHGVDAYGDTVFSGAYKSTLENRKRPVQMRWNHYGDVIGKWLTIKEDEHGLYVEGELTPGHTKANDVYALLKHGAISGLSIGYRPVKSVENETGGRDLHEIDLVEISVVESPADLSAQIANVKSAIADATTLKEIESLLRDAGGFSRADACALVARIKSMGQSDSAPEKKASFAQLLALNAAVATLS